MSNIINGIATLGALAITGYFIYKVVLPNLPDEIVLPSFKPQFPPLPSFIPQQQQQYIPPTSSGGGGDEDDDSGPSQPSSTAAQKPVATGPVGKGMTPEALGFKSTGKKVAMNKGANHRNGQRYNVNHVFKNYIMMGIFKTGSGQEVIEMKTDGPNHGSCKSLPKCTWLEPDLKMDGSAHLGAEFPHPTNHNDRPCPSCKSLGTSIAGKTIGFAVGAWQTGQYRTVSMWADPTGTGNGWKQLLLETDKGQITKPDLATRALPTDGKGLEAEIRMHGAKSGDTTMSNCFVYEIAPPAGAAYTYVYARPQPYEYLYNRFGYGGRRL